MNSRSISRVAVNAGLAGKPTYEVGLPNTSAASLSNIRSVASSVRVCSTSSANPLSRTMSRITASVVNSLESRAIIDRARVTSSSTI